MNETAKSKRLDLYEQIADIRNRFERIYKKEWTNTAKWFNALYNSIELEWISRVAQYMTIKWMKLVIAVNKPIVEEMEEAK